MATPTIVTAPATMPVTIDEVKAHLRIQLDDNTELQNLWRVLAAATAVAEAEASRKFVTQTLDATFDRWPDLPYFTLDGGRLQSITSLKYTDSDDAETTWSSANYFAHTSPEPGWLHLAYNVSWPSVTLKPVGGIVIRYVVGYGSGDQVPEDIRAALLLIVGELWENREDSVIGQGLTPATLPRGARALLQRHKIWSV